MSDTVSVLVLSPSDDKRGGIVPGGIFVRLGDALQIVPENRLIATDVSFQVVQLPKKAEWVVVDSCPAWVYALTTRFPCMGVVLQSGEYVAEWYEDKEIYVLTRLKALLPLPAVVMATRTRSTGYMRKWRDDAVGYLPSLDARDAMERLRQLFGSSNISVRNNIVTVTWSDSFGRPITTVLSWEGRWVVESVGVCVSGDDRFVPVEAVRAVVEQYYRQGGAGPVPVVVMR